MMDENTEHTDEQEDRIERLEEKIDAIAEEVGDMHTIMIRRRNFKRAKAIVILVIVLVWLGYMYHLYRIYQPKVLDMYERFTDLRAETGEVVDSVQNFKSTIDSVNDILMDF